MPSSGAAVCVGRPLLRAPRRSGLPVRGQTVPERVGRGDPRRDVRRRGHRQGAGLRSGPTGEAPTNALHGATHRVRFNMKRVL